MIIIYEWTDYIHHVEWDLERLTYFFIVSDSLSLLTLILIFESESP